MSLPETGTHNVLTEQDVLQISRLASLLITDEKAKAYATGLNAILDLMEDLQQVNTDGVHPMHSPFAVAQPLRADVVTEKNQRELLQSVAPAVAEGCYLVPKVIE